MKILPMMKMIMSYPPKDRRREEKEKKKKKKRVGKQLRY